MDQFHLAPLVRWTTGQLAEVQWLIVAAHQQLAAGTLLHCHLLASKVQRGMFRRNLQELILKANTPVLAHNTLFLHAQNILQHKIRRKNTMQIRITTRHNRKATVQIRQKKTLQKRVGLSHVADVPQTQFLL
ncbi:MAG: hypothetical protein FWD61_12300 [Phycisphaerales bacterium]|nr:hypothetical protein [Phycisphaerales bacterium]